MSPLDGNETLHAAALSLIAAAAATGTTLRLLGGIAVWATCPSSRSGPYARSCGDIDLVAAGRASPVEAVFSSCAWSPDAEFNLYNGETRLRFRKDGAKADVFLGGFKMCHRVPLGRRLGFDAASIPLAELLLTKLQIVEANPKDLGDAACILLDHEVGARDGDSINVSALAEACADDWGLWRTTTESLRTLAAWLASGGVAGATTANARIQAILAALEREPKTLRWRARAAVGERVRWYELPEEVDR